MSDHDPNGAFANRGNAARTVFLAVDGSLGDDAGGPGSAAVRTASASAHVPTQATCRSCHANPHDARDGLGCHVEVGARERREQAAEHLRFAHAPHLSVTLGQCNRCHAGVVDDRPEPPSMATLPETIAAAFAFRQPASSVTEAPACS
jgi:hypothetical protein